MMKILAYISAGLLCLWLILTFLIPNERLFQLSIAAERYFAGLTVHKVQVGELEIEYLRGGQGPKLLLLHGFGADKDNWNRLAHHLTKSFDVIAPDLPGFGNSSKDASLDYDALPQAKRLKQFTDALGISTFHLAGNSMGGYIAGNFAVLYPESVQSLMLLAPFGVTGAQSSEMFIELAQGKSPRVLVENKEQFRQLLEVVFVEPPFIPQAIVDHLAQQAEQSLALNTRIFHQIHHLDQGVPQPSSPLNRVLKGYAAPTLVLWGDKDRVLDVSGAEVLKPLLVNPRIEVMANVGHLPMIEVPGQTADIINDFIDMQ
ncbi:alpha/beta fold hydrolase [Thalassomonas actiniarum]|uniref:Alpha/beta fold hydrolase n=1 Tax=Thalassomonas actiniarum TaxID=485447 RepID=A0AAE9YQE5_9GAMM|nr:alpha/beta fold hydrolase [Thalassomonas actiniarum]WDD98548.1 alpha/beta fold hydrolase [Thalassomonas actiniarum]